MKRNTRMHGKLRLHTRDVIYRSLYGRLPSIVLEWGIKFQIYLVIEINAGLT